MSFSSKLKRELIDYINKAKCDQQAELFGVLLAAARPSEGVLEIRTESEAAFKKYFTSFSKALKITPVKTEITSQHANGKTTYFLRVLEDDVGPRIDEFSVSSAPDCCRRAFLRGAFIAGGSVSDPNKSYHLDIIAETEENAELLKEVMESFNIAARISKRRGKAVVYLKGAEEISRMLAVLGAGVSMMDFENTRIFRGVKGNTNRRANCEFANIYKTVSASIKQIEDIELLEERSGLKNLKPELRQTALLRLENPEASLSELGQMLNPPIGRSGVSHRLKKISELAETYM